MRPGAEYPFFADISGPLAADELISAFPTDVARFNNSKTNSTLAEAVAARMLLTDSAGVGSVVMVSDFLKDVALSQQQLEFLNTTQLTYEAHLSGVLNWVQNPQLQIKLIKLVSSKPSAETTTESAALGHLILRPAKFDRQRREETLSWAYEGPSAPGAYDLAVRGVTGGTVYSKSGLIATRIAVPAAASGQFRWTVVAQFEPGHSVQQTGLFVVPDSDGNVVGALVLVLALLAMLVLAVFLIRKHGMPDALGFFRKKKNRGSDLI